MRPVVLAATLAASSTARSHSAVARTPMRTGSVMSSPTIALLTTQRDENESGVSERDMLESGEASCRGGER